MTKIFAIDLGLAGKRVACRIRMLPGRAGTTKNQSPEPGSGDFPEFRDRTPLRSTVTAGNATAAWGGRWRVCSCVLRLQRADDDVAGDGFSLVQDRHLGGFVRLG